jgi:hypothetical protein
LRTPGPTPLVSTTRQRVSARVAANRRNALKSTGPRTAAGKRRVALNRITRGLCSEEAERKLRARGEEPREFHRLYRDLIAIFQPGSQAAAAGVEQMAWTWWEKARRIRSWVAAGAAHVEDLDTELDHLLLYQAAIMRRQHEWWISRLTSVVGEVGSPAEVRGQIEKRLFAFGGKPGRRAYPREHQGKSLLRKTKKVYGPKAAEVLRQMQEISSPEVAGSSESGSAVEGSGTQMKPGSGDPAGQGNGSSDRGD